MKSKLKPASRYILLIATFSILANAVLGALLMRQSRAAIKSLINSRMLDIANTAAHMIDGDALRGLTPEDQGTEGYEEVMAILSSFRDNIELSYIYCIRDMGGGNFVFGLDPAVDAGEFGSPVVYTDALYRASRGTPSVDESPYEDAWGAFYSAYSPVRDSVGRVAGIVAVDFSEEWYAAQSAVMVRTTVIICAVTLAVELALAFLLISKNKRRVHTVNEQLGELSASLETLMLEVQNMTGVGASEGGESVEAESYDIDDPEALTQRLAVMQRDLREEIDKVHAQACYDKTTGVMNKECYLRAQKAMDDMVKKGLAEFSILIFNLNELAELNMVCGHEHADLALRDAANVLRSTFGRDRVFRIGGGEFIVIAETTSKSDIQNGFSSVEFRMAKENVREKPYGMPLSLSTGYAVYDPETDREYMDVLRRAEEMRNEDVAAHAAKHGAEQG